MENILLEVLAETLNVSPEELSSTLRDEDGNIKESAKQEILNRHSEHIKTVKSSAKEEGKGWGVKEAMKGFESSLLEKYGIENTDGYKGVDLVDRIIETKLGSETKTLKEQLIELQKSKGFTEEDIKKSQAYMNLEKQVQSFETEKEKAVNEAVSNLTRQIQEREVFSSVVENGLTFLEKLNPILSEDPERRKAQVNDLYVSELSKFGYSKLENGEIMILDKETGKRIDNEQGHAMTLDRLFKKIAERKFDFKKSREKDFFDDKEKGEEGGELRLPQTEEEMFDFLGDKTKPIKDRNKVEELWKAKQLPFQK